MPVTDGDLAQSGAIRIPHAVPLCDLEALTSELADVDQTAPGVRLHGRPALTQALSADGVVGRVVEKTAGEGSRPVRAVLFDKSEKNNWSLGWHQDRVIAVRARLEEPGFGPWTVKDGIPHVAPPFELLQGMVTARVHFDDVDEDNAPLLIAPGTHHQLHRIEAVADAVARAGTEICVAQAGDIWLYATPILHASAVAANPRRRRVLQVDFSREDLPGELEWFGV